MSRTQRLLLAAGLVPLPWFLFWTIVGAFFAPDYSSISQHASELLQIPAIPGACLRIAAIGSGMAFVCFAVGLWQRIRSSTRSRSYLLADLWLINGNQRALANGPPDMAFTRSVSQISLLRPCRTSKQDAGPTTVGRMLLPRSSVSPESFTYG